MENFILNTSFNTSLRSYACHINSIDLEKIRNEGIKCYLVECEYAYFINKLLCVHNLQ